MTYSEWLSIGAMAISIFAAGFGKRQAEAAEAANKLAAEANARAEAAQRALAFRWEISHLGVNEYLLINAGVAEAHNVRITAQESLLVSGPHVEKMSPSSQYLFTLYPDGDVWVARAQIKVRWEDRTGNAVVERDLTTELPWFAPPGSWGAGKSF